jgi:putative FmdB family regulatory protein
MPVYDYLCDRCGPFTDMRPMAECELPRECPSCGENAPRAFLSVPYLAAMSSERRLAYATNERSASSPLTLSGAKKHPGGCSCCSGRSLRSQKKAAAPAEHTAAKSFPGKRPWMISH